MPRLIAAMLRHGEYRRLADTPDAHQPFPLTESGLRQARETAPLSRKRFVAEGWQLHAVIEPSNLLRGWQTARELADMLAERGLGSAANLTVGQIEDIIETDPRFPPMPPDWQSNSRYRPPLQGAESLIDAGERVAGHTRQRMEQLAGQVGVDTVQVFVGHGPAFRHAALHLGCLAFDDIRRLSMYHARSVHLLVAKDGKPWRHIGGDWKTRSAVGRYADGID